MAMVENGPYPQNDWAYFNEPLTMQMHNGISILLLLYKRHFRDMYLSKSASLLTQRTLVVICRARWGWLHKTRTQKTWTQNLRNSALYYFFPSDGDRVWCRLWRRRNREVELYQSLEGWKTKKTFNICLYRFIYTKQKRIFSFDLRRCSIRTF